MFGILVISKFNSIVIWYLGLLRVKSRIHPTLGSGGKGGLKIYHAKREIKQTDTQTDTQTDYSTTRLNRPSGPIRQKMDWTIHMLC